MSACFDRPRAANGYDWAAVPIDVRMSRYTTRAGVDECWLWTGTTDKDGYGQTWYGAKRCKAHRVAWELANKCEVPNSLFVLHSCDVPGCVNPGHLYVGTHGDNMRDRQARGRGRWQYGDKHSHARLSTFLVSMARVAYAEGVPVSEINDELAGVNRMGIRKAVAGKSWKHITDPPPVAARKRGSWNIRLPRRSKS